MDEGELWAIITITGTVLWMCFTFQVEATSTADLLMRVQSAQFAEVCPVDG
jgi:hypothetical protein